MATFFQAETPANLEKLPHINKEYAVKHIFNTRNHARFKRELFSKWKKKERKGEERSGEQGKESFFNEQIFIQNRIKPTNHTCIYTQNIILPITPPNTLLLLNTPRNAFPKTNNIFL